MADDKKRFPLSAEARKRLLEDPGVQRRVEELIQSAAAERELDTWSDFELSLLIEETWMAELSITSPQFILLTNVIRRLRRAGKAELDDIVT